MFSFDLRALTERVTRVKTQLETVATEEKKWEDIGVQAKHFLDHREEMKKVIQDSQTTLFGSKISLFENFLSSLTHDTMPEHLARDVKFEFRHKNNKPHLKMNLMNQGFAEDAENASGGSISNILEIGQRYLALHLSQKRKFMVMDEPDCWLRTEHVPRFFQTIAAFSSELEIQTVVISHHPINSETIPYCVELIKNQDNSISVHPNFKPEEVWVDDSVTGVRYVELENVHGHALSRIPLAPTTTALIGDNNIGKSSLNIALRSMAYDLGDDSLIKHHAGKSVVRIGIENGKVITYTRAAKGSPKEVWSLSDKDGNVIHSTKKFEDAMVWLGKEWRVDAQESMEIQLSHQKKPAEFLMMENSKRAQMLNLGQDAMYMDDLQQCFNEDIREKQSLLNQSEKQLEKFRRIKNALPHDVVDVLTTKFNHVYQNHDVMEKTVQQKNSIEKVLPKIIKTNKQLDLMKNLPLTQVKMISTLNSSSMFKTLNQAIKVDSLNKLLKQLPVEIKKTNSPTTLSMWKILDKTIVVYSRYDLLNKIPSNISKVEDKKPLKEMLTALLLSEKLTALKVLNQLPEKVATIKPLEKSKTLMEITQKAFSLVTEKKAINQNLIMVEQELKALPDLNGIACPLCGSTQHAKH